MILLDLENLLKNLAKKRPVFHSEADFQHALAWEIHQAEPEARIRLEYRPERLAKRMYVDIWALVGDLCFPIELKYKTRRLTLELPNERFDLMGQGAQDIGRYDFLRDVERLEAIAAEHKNARGYAILLTNDSAYWSLPRNLGTVDAAFRLHEGRTVSGTLMWDEKAGPGTTRGRERPITLQGRWRLQWQEYSVLTRGSYGSFNYLLVRIPNSKPD